MTKNEFTTTRCGSREEFFAIASSELFGQRAKLEEHIATEFRESESWLHRGFCLIDHCAVNFEVDHKYGWMSSDGLRTPNWRERIVCPKCWLNNRQRAMAIVLLQSIELRSQQNPESDLTVYMMEQVTAVYRLFDERLLRHKLLGSEYIDPGYRSGQVVDGIRHEDAETLSFPDSSVDFVASNDVLEHVNEPLDALREIVRVLRPGGEMFLTIPFKVHKMENTRRAEVRDQELHHYLPAQYHGNPLSDEGSLVFMDFGWEMFSDMQAGFSDCSIHIYWNYEYGHLGGPQFYFHGVK